ncbi:MAG: metallophosphoesterase [Oscillospiraceae bacterium]|nr:metallophosphoesterase [Oscillospiraceae bacterium]
MKKLTAMLCCMALLVTLLPAAATPALAAEGTELTATSGNLNAGSYYLSGDLTLTGSLSVKSDVSIDLNGHTITMPTSVDKSMFVISADGELTVKDTGTGGTMQFGTTTSGAPGVNVTGKFTLESGTITGWKRASAGGAVYLNAGATFTMNGGSITDCEATYAGAVRAAGAGATFTMNGGTITGNNCSNATNYSVVDLRGTADGAAVLNVNGGTISGNTWGGAAYTAGGSEIYCRDTVTTITGGTLGHIYSLLNKLSTGDKLAISGKPVIAGVCVKDTDNTPATITKLVEGASITAHNTVFETDDTVVVNGSVYTYGVKEPAASDALDFSADSSIKLSADVTTGGISLTTAGNYVLDLNGKTVNGTKAPYITIGSGVTLTVRDSAGGGKIKGMSTSAAMLKVAAGGKLVLASGTLTGHTNSGNGGAVYNAGTFEMTGGTISGNTAKYGGAILVDKGSVTNISGGTITDNRATYRGGALSTPDATVADEALQPVINISGGSITANRADNNSSTMYIYTSKVTISGGIMGYGGKLNATTGKYDDGDGAGDIWIRGSVLTITGGKMDDLATRPDTNFNFTLNISGNPEIEAAYPAFTVGNFTTTATVGTLTSGAYIKSNTEIPVAADAKNVHVTSGTKGWFYRCATDNVDDAVTTTDAITNVTIQPGADETGRNFNWFSTSDAAGYITYAKAADLVDGVMPANAAKVAAEREVSLKPGYYHNKASVVGLEPGNEYAYQLSNGSDVSPVYTFEVEQKSDTFNFAFVGDPQLGQPHIPIARQVDGWSRTLGQLTGDPVFAGIDLVVSAGDQITSADANDDGVTNSTMYNAFLNHEEMTGLTFAPMLGNHDSWTRGEHYQQFNAPGYMVNPATGKYYGITENYGMTNSADYWFVYNSVLFVCLNVNDFVYGGAATHTQAKRDQNKQTAEYHLEFIDKVLELNEDNEDIQWKVIVYHESPYGSSYHGNFTQNADGLYEERPEQHMFVDMREYLLPGIYDRDFDVVLSGHDHTYTRSHILKHEAVDTDSLYYGNETVTPFENTFGNNYYTYADGTTSPTFVNWSDSNGVVHTDKKTASLPVKVTNPDGVLHITASSSSGSTNNAAVHEHPAVAVVHSGREPKRQAILVEVTPTTLTFTNYGLGTANEDYVLADNVIDTFTIERVEEQRGTVTVEQGANGTISVDKTEGAYGETVTVTVKSDSGYKLKEILVDGAAIAGKTFAISGDHMVTAVFVERGDEPLLGSFSLQVIKTITLEGQTVDICRWVWTPFED